MDMIFTSICAIFIGMVGFYTGYRARKDRKALQRDIILESHIRFVTLLEEEEQRIQEDAEKLGANLLISRVCDRLRKEPCYRK